MRIIEFPQNGDIRHRLALCPQKCFLGQQAVEASISRILVANAPVKEGIHVQFIAVTVKKR
jgi:hypothetical protein